MTEINVTQVCREVAAALGVGWRAATRDGRDDRVVGPDGDELVIRENWGSPTPKPGQVNITGSYPGELYRLADAHHSINVTVSRGAVVMAREIERRLLPQYRVSLERARAAAEAAARDAASATAAVNRLTDVFPGVYGHHVDKTRVYFDGGTAEVDNDGSTAELRLRGIPVDTAVRIGELLTERGTSEE